MTSTRTPTSSAANESAPTDRPAPTGARRFLTLAQHHALLREIPGMMREQFAALAEELDLTPAEQADFLSELERIADRTKEVIRDRLARPR